MAQFERELAAAQGLPELERLAREQQLINGLSDGAFEMVIADPQRAHLADPAYYRPLENVGGGPDPITPTDPEPSQVDATASNPGPV